MEKEYKKYSKKNTRKILQNINGNISVSAGVTVIQKLEPQDTFIICIIFHQILLSINFQNSPIILIFVFSSILCAYPDPSWIRNRHGNLGNANRPHSNKKHRLLKFRMPVSYEQGVVRRR